MRTGIVLNVLLLLLMVSSCGISVTPPSSDGMESSSLVITPQKLLVSQYRASVVKGSNGVYGIRLVFDCTTQKRGLMNVHAGDTVVFRFKNGDYLSLRTDRGFTGVNADEDTRRLLLVCPVTVEGLGKFLQSPLYSVEWMNRWDYAELEVPLDRSIIFAQIVSEYVFRKQLSPSIIDSRFKSEIHTVIDEDAWDY